MERSGVGERQDLEDKENFIIFQQYSIIHHIYATIGTIYYPACLWRLVNYHPHTPYLGYFHCSFITECLFHAVYLQKLQAGADGRVRGNTLFIIISRALNGLVQQFDQSTAGQNVTHTSHLFVDLI